MPPALSAPPAAATTTMRAIRKDRAAAGLTFHTDQPVPEPKEGEVRIRVSAVGICGTDVHIYDWDKWSSGRMHPPTTIGHEFVGIVEKVGPDVSHVQPGQRVSAEGHITCGVCQFCRTGEGHICRDVKIIGVDRDGCMADFIVMPAGNLWPVPDSLPDKFAALYDPLGNAMHTVMAQPVGGKSVVIMGAGAIGLMAVAIAKTAGAGQVFAVDPNPKKRDLATKVGADRVVNPAAEDPVAIIREATQGYGADVVLEMSGHPTGIGQALAAVRNGGEVALLGIPSKEVSIDLSRDVIFKGITLRGINGRRMYTTWYQSQDFLVRNHQRIAPLVSHVFKLEEFEAAFDLLHRGEACKIVFDVNMTK
ncbi:MAG: L-threonine 3-dehydrogenase [Planctomycetota bacterium]